MNYKVDYFPLKFPEVRSILVGHHFHVQCKLLSRTTKSSFGVPLKLIELNVLPYSIKKVKPSCILSKAKDIIKYAMRILHS